MGVLVGCIALNLLSLWDNLLCAETAHLDVVAIAFYVCPLCIWTRCLAPDESCIFDAVFESMTDDWIVPVDDGGE